MGSSFGINDFYLNYTNKDGLPSNKVYYCTQDKFGIIWLGTDNGLCKFNGFNFEVISVKDGLPDNDVYFVNSDAENRMWVICYNQAPCYFLNDKLYTIKNDTFLANNFTNSASYFINYNASLKRIKFQVIKNNQLICVELGNKHINLTKLIGAKNFINGLNLYKDKHEFLLGGNYAINISTNKVVEQRNYQYLLDIQQIKINNSILGISYNRDGNNTHIFRFSEDSFKTIKIFDNKSFRGPFLCRDNNILYINEVGELYKLNVTTYKLESLDMSIGKTNIGCIYMDIDQNIWICTLNEGLIFISKNRGKFKNEGKIYAEKILKFNNHLYAASIEKELIKCIPKVQKIALPYKYIRWRRITDVLNLSDTFYIIGDFEKMAYKFNTKKIIYDGTKAVTNKTKLNVFLKDIKRSNYNKNYILLAGNSGAGFTLKNFSNEKLFWNTKSTSICDDKKGNIYIGTLKGLFKTNYENKPINPVIHQKLLLSRITDIESDNSGNIFIGTAQYGLFIINTKNRIVNLTNENIGTAKISGYYVKRIFIDLQNRIWVATDKGITMLAIDDELIKTTQISGKSIIPEQNINDIFVEKDTVFVLGFSSIFQFVFNQRNLSEKPGVLFKNFSVNSLAITFYHGIKLGANQNNVSIGFTPIAFRFADNIRYYYKLNDGNWISTISTRIDFNALNADKYRVQIKAINELTNESSNILEINFIIQPKWYNTWWFYLSVIILLGILTYLIVIFRSRRLARAAAKESEFNRKVAEIELQSLRGQMNPHFIFNALNSVQSLIFQKEEIKASEYLGKISTMFRDALEFSRNPEITLRSEIQFIKKYLEIEQLRFPNKFKYTIKIAEELEINLDNIVFPSLLMQPIVENAVKHGMKTVKGNGEIRIKLFQRENRIHYSVEDNGGGFSHNSSSNHISRGMQIVNQRIQILNQTMGENYFTFTLVNKPNIGVKAEFSFVNED